jgi:TonB family protein
MRHMRIIILIALSVAPAAHLSGADLQTIGALLDKTYAGQTLILRSFHAGSTLLYSSTGKFLKGGKPGPWTLDACLRVKEVDLQPEKLLIKGERLEYAYFKDHKSLEPIVGHKVTVQILTNPQTAGLSSLQDAIASVFIARGQRLADFVPDYWRLYLLHPGQFNSDASVKEMSVKEMKEMTAEVAALIGMRRPTKAETKGTIPPRSLHHREPSYTREAGKFRLQGWLRIVVEVGVDGRVKREILVKPLGLGLDENAAEAIRRWKFRPAVRDGKRVQVLVMVATHFQLFRN